MRRDLVEDRGWYSEDEYQQGLAVAQTMPGPLAAQLAMWLGYLERGSLGALAVTVPFVMPPFLIVTAVGIIYTDYQGLAAIEDIFYGVGAVVVAIVAIAGYKLARSTNKRDPVLWIIATLLAVSTVISGPRSSGRSSSPVDSARSTTAEGYRDSEAAPHHCCRFRSSDRCRASPGQGRAMNSARWRSSSSRPVPSPSAQGWRSSRSSSRASLTSTTG
jgi:hypothetical protein